MDQFDQSETRIGANNQEIIGGGTTEEMNRGNNMSNSSNSESQQKKRVQTKLQTAEEYKQEDAWDPSLSISRSDNSDEFDDETLKLLNSPEFLEFLKRENFMGREEFIEFVNRIVGDPEFALGRDEDATTGKGGGTGRGGKGGTGQSIQVKGNLPPQRKIYSIDTDTTIHPSDRKRCTSTPAPNDVRLDSRQTIGSYSTGAHEVFPTSTYIILYKLLNSTKKRGQGSKTTVPNKAWAQGKGATDITTSNIQRMLEIALGFRTDTAQTLLVNLNSIAAAHSGSDINTKGQNDAHNLLRRALEGIVKSASNQKTMSAFMGALTVTSMAPGQMADKLQGTKDLKDQEARSKWEKYRNEAKRRVVEVYDVLSPPEQKIVTTLSQKYLTSTQTTGGRKRQLATNRPVTPERIETGGTNIKGGGYKKLNRKTQNEFLWLVKATPKDIRQMGAYVTQSFRTDKRTRQKK